MKTDSFDDENITPELLEPIEYRNDVPICKDDENFRDTKSNDLKMSWQNTGNRINTFKWSRVVSAFDVAEYILKKLGSLSTMKLQKLVYYCQAWSLVWDEKPLFKENIEAWTNGPVIRELFSYHRGHYQISKITLGNPDVLLDEQKETIDAVLDFYGDKSSQWLIELSHSEKPWQEARKNLKIDEISNKAIPLETMAEYYSSLQ